MTYVVAATVTVACFVGTRQHPGVHTFLVARGIPRSKTESSSSALREHISSRTETVEQTGQLQGHEKPDIAAVLSNGYVQISA